LGHWFTHVSLSAIISKLQPSPFFITPHLPPHDIYPAEARPWWLTCYFLGYQANWYQEVKL